jgi:hypothetical protein
MGREWLSPVEAVFAVLESFPERLIQTIRLESHCDAAVDHVFDQALLAVAMPGIMDDRPVGLAHVALLLVFDDLVHGRVPRRSPIALT